MIAEAEARGIRAEILEAPLGNAGLPRAERRRGNQRRADVAQIVQQPDRHIKPVARIVEEEIARLVREGVTPEEMTRARNTFLAQMLGSLESVQGKADQLQYYNYFVGTPDYVQEDAARYASARAADVQRVAREYLTQPRVLLTVVPQGKTELMVQTGARN